MKNIKVNIINTDGIKSSTTINKNIAEYYYYAAGSDDDRMTLKDWVDLPTCNYTDKRNEIIRKMVQAAADIHLQDVLSRGVIKGITKDGIENHLLDKILMNTRFK